MGLDMHLDKEISTLGKCVKVNEKVIENVDTVTQEVIYWRKANAIHKYFVDKWQGGVDECQRTWIPREALQDLLEVCEKVKAQPEKAEELLPTKAGFFFGSTEYDEHYHEDIDKTIESLRKELANEDNGTYYYHSSW